MKPKEIKEILHGIGAGTRKSLGQHFLIDERVLKDIVKAAEIKKGEQVLEIGPGLGVLTRELLDAGARVTAIEKDKKFVVFLTNTIPGLRQAQAVDGNIISPERSKTESKGFVIQGDAAKLDWNELVGKEWKLVSNLPYAITSLALRKTLTAKHPPQKIIVLIQKEVAERALAKTGKQSLLSLMVSLYAKSARIVRKVGKGAFYPRPKVESAVLELIPFTVKEREEAWNIDPEQVMKLAKIGFAHPRKKLLSNLKSQHPEMPRIFDKIGLSSDARAEDLQPRQWVDLALLTAS